MSKTNQIELLLQQAFLTGLSIHKVFTRDYLRNTNYEDNYHGCSQFVNAFYRIKYTCYRTFI